MTRRVRVILLSTFFAAAATAEEPQDYGTVWAWFNPESLEQALVVSVTNTEKPQDERTKSLYVESPQGHQAQLNRSYDPKIAGYHLSFYDLQTGWEAEITCGILLANNKSLLPVSEVDYVSFVTKIVAAPEVRGVYFIKFSMSNGIEFAMEHDIHIEQREGETDLSRLLDAFERWIDELSDEQRIAQWDFPVSVRETLEFLSTASPKALQQSSPFLELYSGVVARAAERLINGAEEPKPRPVSGGWTLETGSLGGEFAERAGAANLIESIRKSARSQE